MKLEIVTPEHCKMILTKGKPPRTPDAQLARPGEELTSPGEQLTRPGEQLARLTEQPALEAPGASCILGCILGSWGALDAPGGPGSRFSSRSPRGGSRRS